MANLAALTTTTPFSPADRRALGAVATQFFVNGAVVASFVPRLPEIRDDIDLTLDRLGLILALAVLAGIAGSFVVGRVVASIGTRTLMIAGGLGLVASLAVIGMSSSLWMLVIGLLGVQLFDVLVDVPMNLQASWLSARRHAPVMNRLHGLWSLGTVVGALVAAQTSASAVSLRTHLLAAAALFAITILVVGRNLLPVDERDADAAPSGTQRAGSRWTLLLLLGAASGAAFAAEGTSSDWAAFRLVDDLGASAGLAALGYVAYTLGMTTGRFAGDSVMLRIGDDRLVRLSIALATAGTLVANFVDATAAVLLGLFATGLGVATFFPTLYDQAAKMPGGGAGGLGAVTAGTRIVGLAAPLVVGALAATDRVDVGTAVAAVLLPSLLAFAAIMWPRPGGARFA